MPQGLAYYSPVIAGFDGAFSWNPSNNTGVTASACTSSFTGCTSQSASSAAGDIARWTNRIEFGLRYRNAFGPIGLAISGTYGTSGTVQPSPGAPTTGSGAVRFNPLNFGIIGAEVSINKFFAIGANTMFGAFNGAGALQAKPIAAQGSATTAIAWEAGAKMSVPTLPVVFGASYYNFKFQGQPGLGTQRDSQGFDVGGSYGLGPGMVAFVEYLWGQNKQGGFNFLTGSCYVAAVCSSTVNANQNNTVTLQTVMVGLAFQF
jgi:predicted porin